MAEQGTVKWFDESKNYGFITPDVGHEDIFFYRSDLDTLGQAIEKGERVAFEIGQGAKGREARHVVSLEEGS